MADIALLVAEEFDKKRAKRGAPSAGEPQAADRSNFGAVAKVWRSWVESASNVAAVQVQLMDLVVEPKTGLALAAVDGVFSA